MKKVIIMGLFMALLTTAKSQVSFSVPVGVSTRKVPTIGANFQIGIKAVIFAAGFDAQMSQKVKNGDFLWARLGAGFYISDLNRLEITAGRGIYRRSSDVKSLNEGLNLINVQYIHALDPVPHGAVFGSVTGTKEFIMFTGGLRFIFGKRDKISRYGCPLSI